MNGARAMCAQCSATPYVSEVDARGHSCPLTHPALSRSFLHISHCLPYCDICYWVPACTACSAAPTPHHSSQNSRLKSPPQKSTFSQNSLHRTSGHVTTLQWTSKLLLVHTNDRLFCLTHYFLVIFLKNKQDRQSTHNAMFRSVRATIVAVEKQWVLHIPSIRLQP